jgi:hypothetical protein
MSRPLTYTHWTTHEMKRLRESYATMSRDDLALAFAPHPIRSILSMATAMKLRKRCWRTICAQHKSTLFRDGRFLGMSA